MRMRGCVQGVRGRRRSAAEAPRSASVSTTRPIAAVSDVFAGCNAGSVAATARSVMSASQRSTADVALFVADMSGVAVVDSPDVVVFDAFRFPPSATPNLFVLF